MKPQGKEARITRGDLVIDTERMSIHWQDHAVGLTLTEFWLVYALARFWICRILSALSLIKFFGNCVNALGIKNYVLLYIWERFCS